MHLYVGRVFTTLPIGNSPGLALVKASENVFSFYVNNRAMKYLPFEEQLTQKKTLEANFRKATVVLQ